jgi:F0F1-type ATP synthase assembly protein I
MTSSDSDIRPLASRILRVQCGFGVATALACGTIWGRYALVSALVGAATGVTANLYMTYKALRPAGTPRGALGRVYYGQLVKVVLTVGMFLLAAHMPHVSWPALLLAYASTLLVFWWVPFAWTPGPRPQARPEM